MILKPRTRPNASHDLDDQDRKVLVLLQNWMGGSPWPDQDVEQERYFEEWHTRERNAFFIPGSVATAVISQPAEHTRQQVFCLLAEGMENWYSNNPYPLSCD